MSAPLMKISKHHIICFIFILINAVKIVFIDYLLSFGNSYVTALYFNFAVTILALSIIYFVIFSYGTRLIFSIFFIIQCLYLSVMLTYFFYSGNYISIKMVYLLFSESKQVVENAYVPFYRNTLVAFIDLPLFVYMFVTFPKYNCLLAGVRINVLLILSVGLISIVTGASIMKKGPFDNYLNNEYVVVGRYGLLTKQAMDYLYLEDNEQELTYGKELLFSKNINNHPNIIIIQVESLDANVLSFRHNGAYVAPKLKQLADSNLYYPFMLSILGAGGSSDAEVATLNSAEPPRSFPIMKSLTISYPNSVLHALHSNGYSTIAFHNNEKEYYSRNLAFPKMGFEKFIGRKEMNLHRYNWGGSDHEMFNYISKYSDSLKQPYILYVITMSSHEPFNLVNDYYSTPVFNDIKNKNVKNYLTSISYVDSVIAAFVKAITTRDTNTVVMIYGDHSPGIHTDEYKDASVVVEGKKLRFVPLIIVSDKKKYYKTDTIAVSFLDIAPTLLQLASIQCTYHSNGQKLCTPGKCETLIPYYNSIYDRSYLYKKVNYLE